MKNAFASLVAGFLLYLVVFLRQSRDARMDRSAWRDYLAISSVASLALLGLMFWVAIGLGPGASGDSVLEHLFASRRSRYVWMPYAGFGAIAFSACAALHVAVLTAAFRNRDEIDAQ